MCNRRCWALGPLPACQYEEIYSVLENQEDSLTLAEIHYAMSYIREWGITLQEVVCPMRKVMTRHLVSHGKIILKDSEIKDIVRYFQHSFNVLGARKLFKRLKKYYVGLNERIIQKAINEEKIVLGTFRILWFLTYVWILRLFYLGSTQQWSV